MNNYVKNNYVTIACFFLSLQLYSQNLVPNPGFEPSCDGHAYQIPLSIFLKPWVANTESAVFEDYYGGIVRDQLLKNEESLGETYLVMDVYYGEEKTLDKVSCHGYIETPLIVPMIKEHVYYCEIKVYVLRALSNARINNLGFLFTTKAIKFDSCSIINSAPQVYEPNIIDPVNRWQTISGIFTARDNFCYLTLGVFFPDSLVNSIHHSNEEGIYKNQYDINKNLYYNYFWGTRFILDDVKVFEVSKKEKITLNNVLFSSGSYELSSKSTFDIDKIYTAFSTKKYDCILVEGYTDDVGTPEKNQTLSYQRAESIKEYLMRKGLSAEKIICNGYGSSKPIVPNDSDINRSINRRVEIKLLKFKRKEASKKP